MNEEISQAVVVKVEDVEGSDAEISVESVENDAFVEVLSGIRRSQQATEAVEFKALQDRLTGLQRKVAEVQKNSGRARTLFEIQVLERAAHAESLIIPDNSEVRDSKTSVKAKILSELDALLKREFPEE